MKKRNASNPDPLILLGSVKRARYPKKHKFFCMIDWLQKLKGNYYLTLFLNGKTGTFASDNWTSLMHFAIEYFDEKSLDPIVILLRRFEDGPKFSDQIPYKTLVGAMYLHNTWYGQTYEQIESAHITDQKTKAKLPVEQGILFSDFCEEYPDSPATPMPKKT